MIEMVGLMVEEMESLLTLTVMLVSMLGAMMEQCWELSGHLWKVLQLEK
jgi:hypothetical protein